MQSCHHFLIRCNYVLYILFYGEDWVLVCLAECLDSNCGRCHQPDQCLYCKDSYGMDNDGVCREGKSLNNIPASKYIQGAEGL